MRQSLAVAVLVRPEFFRPAIQMHGLLAVSGKTGRRDGFKRAASHVAIAQCITPPHSIRAEDPPEGGSAGQAMSA